MNSLVVGVELMLYGLAGVFVALIMFYGLIKLLVALSKKSNKKAQQ